MNEQALYEILALIIKELDEPILWRLDGSANLLVQGVDVSVNDLDIATDEEGLNVFREVFDEYLIEDFYSEKIQGNSLILDIFCNEIEINCYGDREKSHFDKIKTIDWNNLNIPVLSLELAKEFYKVIGRKEKVELIEKHLNIQVN